MLWLIYKHISFNRLSKNALPGKITAYKATIHCILYAPLIIINWGVLLFALILRRANQPKIYFI
jgi:hypothetical protein